MASGRTSPVANPSEGSSRKDHSSMLSAESEFDDSLGVPPSLSVINVAPKESPSEVDAGPKVQFKNEIPYKSIFNEPIKFSSVHRKVFIPGIEIQVKFAKHERNISSNLLNPNLYVIHLSHGDFSWKISKRYKHILYLHQQLVVYRATLNIPFPTKTHREHRNSVRMNMEESNRNENGTVTTESRKSNRPKLRSPALPRFPKKPEVLVSYDDIPHRMKQLEDYLHSLCNITIYRNHHELITFLEVSNVSFVCELGFKGKECMVKKKAGSTLPGQTGCDCCGLLHYGVCNRCSFFCSSLGFGRWRERWFFVKDTFFGYISPNDGEIKSIMLFDQGFEVSSGIYSTGLNNGLQLLNLNRQMIFRLWTKRKSKEWIEYFKEIANNQARDFTAPNPHRAFVPMRSSVKASSFIDGGGYLSAVGDCLEAAKEEIYITDWWLSPEIYLKRPINGEYWRLDQVLLRKASQGVKVFVLLYKEVEMALGICSYYSKSKLSHENIKVLRHPDHAKAGVFLWAHHEKIVCIDQSIAFVGGIDLCYGRWDDHKHRLSDIGSIVRDNSSRPKSKKMTSSRPRFFKDSIELSEDNASEVEEEIEKSTADEVSALPHNIPTLQPGDHLLMPRSPKPTTSPVVFLEDHYNPDLNSRRNIMDTITDKSKDILSFFGSEASPSAAESSDNKEREKAANYARDMNMFFPESEQLQEPMVESKMAIMPTITEDESGLSVNDVSLISDNDKDKSKLWIGKDYANFIVKDFTNLDSPFVDLVDRSTTPRMPWHDIATMVEGIAARDVARHFIQRWNAHKFEKFKYNSTYPYLMPKSYIDINVPNIVPNLEKHSVTCQILRSLSCWSGGFVDPESTEQSIHEAYLESITRAQHYIYIENQFFITLSINSCIVKNQIGEAIYNRILRAHKSKSKFRVFVVMPLLPAFEGEVGASSGTSLHAITHWNYHSISRGKESLIVRLKEAGIKDPSEFITFHGLRTHSVLEGEPVSELIYVHSKLMIVDDRLVICGSANINDRSLLGSRDSEVAVLFQDETFEDGSMNGEVFPSGRFAGSLRKRLFREHLGMIGNANRQQEIDLKDPVIDSFYRDKWLAISHSNTDIFEKVFCCIPTDSVRSFADLKKYQDDNQTTLWETDPDAANKEIYKIVGHLVTFPLEFLVDEVLTPSSKSVMGIMPTSLWT